jgi:hypothetical protein
MADEELQVYNDILNQLITHRFYSSYLGAKGEKLWEDYGCYDMDSTRYDDYEQAIINLHNEIYNDTSLFETICLRSEPNMWTPASYRKEFPEYDSIWNEARNWINVPQIDWDRTIDSLSSGQTKFTSEDFHLCIAKVVPYTKWLNGCGIGHVSFSKVVMNDDQTKAILYFEFMCGGKCGFGEILMIEKIESHWSIQNQIQLWIS